MSQTRRRGASDRRLRTIIAEGLQETYFQHNGTRAQGLDVELADIDYFGASFQRNLTERKPARIPGTDNAAAGG